MVNHPPKTSNSTLRHIRQVQSQDTRPLHKQHMVMDKQDRQAMALQDSILDLVVHLVLVDGWVNRED